MNSIIAVVLAVSVVMAAASYPGDDGYYGGGYNDNYHGGRYGYGFARTPYGLRAAYNNAARQETVNRIAEHVGASSGTARYYGALSFGWREIARLDSIWML